MPENNLIIRRASVKDTDAVAQLYVEAWRKAYKGVLPAHFLSSLSIEQRKKIRTAHLANPNPDIAHFVATFNNKIVGYCDVGPARDDDVPPYTGELYALYVDPVAGRQGLGSGLMAVGVNWLKSHDYDQVYAWVIEGSESDKQFYEKQGWKFDGHRCQAVNHGVSYTEIRYATKIS